MATVQALFYTAWSFMDNNGRADNNRHGKKKKWKFSPTFENQKAKAMDVKWYR